MSIIINIKPEAQAEMTRQAAAHGVRPEDYAAALLEEAVHLGPRAKTLTTDQLDGRYRRLRSSRKRSPSCRMRNSPGKVCTRIMTDGRGRCLSSRQQHSSAHQQER